MAFSFGIPKSTTGFTLPTSTPAVPTAGAGDGSKPGSAGLFSSSLKQAPAAAPGAALNFSLGQAAKAPTFGSPATQLPSNTTGGLSFGFGSTGAAGTTVTATSAAPQFGFGSTGAAGTTVTATSAAPQFGFGSTGNLGAAGGTVATSAGAPQFGLGSTGTLGAAVATAAPTNTPQFGFGSSATVTTSTVTTTSASFMPILGSTTMTSTAATPGGLTFGVPSNTSVAPKFGLGSTTTVTSAIATGSSAVTTAAPTSATTTTQANSTTTPSASTPSESLTFVQLEDCINRWTIDLEEQGKFFINQAKQLNAWDTLLVSNGEKILTLNSSIEKVKQQQTQLDQELDFVLAQQKELEELIAPLEKELADVPVTDMDRYEMYQYSEMIDSQLKQISDDLKEIIESINDATRGGNSKNPVTQIGMILNAHMNSLQWIDRNTTQIGIKLQEISKVEETTRSTLSKSGLNQ